MRWFLVLFSTLLLTACFTAGRRGDAAMAIYDLGPVAESAAVPSRAVPAALEVRAPLWFDSLGINYRLAYAEPARLREYARARWAGPPAQLIEQRLARQLGLVRAGQERAICVLRLDIDEFSQVFASPQTSRAVLQGRLQWLDRSRARLAERPVDIGKDAASSDSSGGVAALTAAVAQLSVDIQSWESDLRAAGRLDACRS